MAAGDRVTQILSGHALDVGGVLDQLVERSVFQQPLGGGLGAHLGNAGHVVHGVADEGLKVDHQIRRHAELGGHAGHVALLAVHGVDDGDAVVHQLRQVLVAAGDDHVDPLLGRDVGERGDHVIGLDAGNRHHFPAQQLHHFMDRLDLRAQVVRHGGTLGFVFGIDLVAEGRAAGVEHADGVVGGDVLAQRLHHIDHAANRAGGRTARVTGNGAQVGHGMEGAVEVAGAVYQHQGLGITHSAHCAAPGKGKTVLWVWFCNRGCLRITRLVQKSERMAADYQNLLQ